MVPDTLLAIEAHSRAVFASALALKLVMISFLEFAVVARLAEHFETGVLPMG